MSNDNSPCNITDTLYAATVGTFDGVHAGHRHLLQQLMKKAAERGLSTEVFTFDKHPANHITGKTAPQQIMDLRRKRARIEQLGIDRVIILDFGAISYMTARQFMSHIRDCAGVRYLLMGFNNHFGSDRIKSTEEYIAIGKDLGIEVEIATEWKCRLNEGNVSASSSRIRTLVTEGRMEDAHALLGHPFAIYGKVVKGYGNGRKIGFPTANIEPDSSEADMLLPANGVYAVEMTLEDGTAHRGVCNIGYRPTISEDGKISIEVHMPGFSGNIYDKCVEVSFLKKLRDEKKFDSVESLMAQIHTDIANALSAADKVNENI